MSQSDPGLVESVELQPGARIHILGVAGTGMGAFASLLQQAGFVITGSDANVYPPMSDMLKAWHIDVMTPYAAGNIERAKPSLVVVGNAIRRENVEAEAVRANALTHMSFPAAFGSLFLGSRHSIVVAGTHGKTTTTALAAHILVEAGTDPLVLVGGVAKNIGGNARFGRGQFSVIEGDEYDTAYFDKGPKFWHYRPKTLIFTSCEFDHADIYRDTAHYESVFFALMDKMPKDGLLCVCAEDEAALRIAQAAPCRIVTYGRRGSGATLQASSIDESESGTLIRFERGGDVVAEARWPAMGHHNLLNAAGVVAALDANGLTRRQIEQGLATFSGVKRRQDVIGEFGGRIVIDDFAHHPTAVDVTLQAVRRRYAGRRVLAAFEPRSNTSRRDTHRTRYVDALAAADGVFLKAPEPTDKVQANERLDVDAFIQALQARGIHAEYSMQAGALAESMAAYSRPGDVLLAMSNGPMGGFVQALTTRLAAE